ncbi:Sulfate/thiosulfate import ATP-binding protein CysA [Hartmannibacter diazotrophicus]|uniref:Sulfate/thiosulfate import ATP-binding protein CysA n=1 Tax=Hartmannibacter diazotrophicus TaxID=1482074 RepID=A0A2C9D6B4_9HYPH|nr:ATP-binding cassette domain-containing protein [Hartmannibacter diazotrophicus]SON55709.1 Sulfate/thiosulfate import ATP-binding protein CysA [Hartmannibacter diazotrophicus]
MSGAALLVDDLTVEFGRFRAIDHLSLAIDYGEIRGMIGPNGAGKTTVLDVVSGLTRPKSGQVLLDGTLDLATAGESAIARAGVRRKFQKPSVFEELTVIENVEIGAAGMLFPSLKADVTAARAREYLELVGLTGDMHRRAGELAHGQKQWLEIAMVLASEPKVLMLDEPVAGLSDEETEKTAELVRSLRHPDRAIVVVEHDMGFVETIADRVTVLHEGRTLFEGSMADARADQRVIDVYLGR